MAVKVGVLALQGAFALHTRALERLGVAVVEVRTREDLLGVDALVLPGGESTAISKLLEANDLFDAIGSRLAGGMPALGTCAGMILLANDVLDGRADQRSFGALDIAVRRNAFGRQVDSFEAEVHVAAIGDQPFHGVFIRAPYVEWSGPGVEVLGVIDGRPVVCRQGPVLATAFHPELSDDLRIHELFLSGSRVVTDTPER
ncbi:pyridoxal 5'-phosphate synthase glutaminase subunit PdxT [Rhabdothermincola sp.]|uniref:pyridoxal 5'-phosphate synthase glutaminase subunit PdxT n=1 Tax=Rhabdothermincola sp. TaxID=2820405 RepID=UPI002FE26069